MAKEWVIFDADNTLWDVETLYDEARDALVSHLGAGGHERGEVIAYQMAIDASLFRRHGYSPTRFPLSFELTLKRFQPSATERDAENVRRLAQAVFSRKAPVFDCASEVLDKLSRYYHLGLMTAGDEVVQTMRIKDSNLSHAFGAIERVDRKDEEAFAKFCRSHCVPIDTSWSVGDSLRADVLPARSIGLNAVWIRHHNWSAVEHSPVEPDPDVAIVDRVGLVPHEILDRRIKALAS